MNKCIVISDSFKGTLSSLDICDIAQETIPTFFPECKVVTIPVADGGEGTVSCFLRSTPAEAVTTSATGPYGETVSATYAHNGPCAIIEMSCTAGLPMTGERPNPEETTTYGVGQLIRHAVESGYKDILLGLGGSATNDAGCGCAAALGTVFYDRYGKSFIPKGKTLCDIERIDTSASDRFLNGAHITVMCDVDNPLYGPSGAAYVFAPQKGADDEMVVRLDLGLRKLSQVIYRDLGMDLSQRPGAGAAGGMGAGCVAFLHAELKSGIESVLNITDFDKQLIDADLVITGEGRIDSQSVCGKAVSGIAKRTSARGVPLVAIVGCIDKSADAAYRAGVTAMFSINRESLSFSESACNAKENYQKTLADILRLIQAAERKM